VGGARRPTTSLWCSLSWRDSGCEVERFGSDVAEAQGSESRLSADMLNGLLLAPGMDRTGGVALLGEWGVVTRHAA
jgi:hypothetical protein